MIAAAVLASALALLTACTADGGGPATSDAAVAVSTSAPPSSGSASSAEPGTAASPSASTMSAPTSATGSRADATSVEPSDQPQNAGREQYAPAVMRVMSTPRWFTGTDRKVHLVYELQLVNAFPVAVTITAVKVRDAARGTVLHTLDGAGLKAAMSLMSVGGTPTVQLAPSSVGVVWMDIPLPNPAAVPGRIDHQLTVRVPPGLPVPAVITDTGGASPVETAAPAVIGPPLAGTGWIAVGSCCDGPHRRSIQPVNDALWLAQRYAIDFNKINKSGLLAHGNRSVNADWYTYDQPVLAVADATVVAAADGFADQIPDAAKPVTLEEADGNHVILKLADGVYAFYAHLKPGSVRVRNDERVAKGQQIGRTGNSGSSTGSHLHFQLMDRPSALVADGLPFEVDTFELAGRSPALEQLMALDPTRDPVSVDTTGAGARSDQLPLGRDVVNFAPAG